MKKLTLLFLAITLLAFTVGDSKSEYNLPRKAFSVFLSDIDIDNDIDIIVGHKTAWQDTNKTISILLNPQNGYFEIADTSKIFCGYQENIFTAKINQDNFPDIVAFFSDFSAGDPERFIRIFYNDNGSFTQYSDFSLNSSSTFTNINYGDVDGNGFDDIVVIINNDFLWGIIYNDGTGNFSAPEYYNLSFPPLDITCADFNDDGRADVVVAGGVIEVYFSTETGFEQQLLGNTLPWSSSYSLLTSDFDNDNDDDVILSATSNSNHSNVYLFENLGNNQFYEHPYFEFTPFCSYSQIADFNNDSLPDMVFIASDNSGLYIYQNKGDFQLEFDQFIFIENYGSYLNRVACEDLDGNKFNDIVTIRSWGGILPSNLNIKFNDGVGNFLDNPITKINSQKSKITNPIICYPNPFNIKTTIEININKNDFTNIEIYDIQGKLIRTFINKTLKPGVYKYIWNGKDEKGKEVTTGLYLVRLKAGRKIFTQRVVYL